MKAATRLAVLAVFATSSLSVSQLGQSAELVPAPGPLDNPLKGWAPYVESWATQHQPYSMAFTYISWRELEPAPGAYNFSALDAKMNVPNGIGKHFVIRIYMDYPSLPTGLPQWLIDAGVRMTPYTQFGGGQSPDYSDPRLVSAMVNLIQAMGQRYGSNPRIATVQLGLLGFWGEWHTYPNPELFAPLAVQRTVIDTWRQAFPNTHLMARYAADYQGTRDWIGFHDDMIPEDTLGPDDWMFLPQMRAAGRENNWKTAPIGGEMVPNAAAQYMGPDFAQLERAVREAHITWIGPYCPSIEADVSRDQRARCEQIVRLMGYQYQLKRVKISRSSDDPKTVKAMISGENQGVAPFYYPWPVQIGTMDPAGKVRNPVTVKVDLRKWLPGPFQFSANVSTLEFGPGRKLVIGIIDPMTRTPRVKFANAEPNIGGWQVLLGETSRI